MYNVLDVISLLNYDDNLEALSVRLSSLYKAEYNANDRIVILHNDTEYFYYNNLTGFTTHNFFNLIRNLDMPLYIFIFLTNYSKYDEAILPFITSTDVPTIHKTLVNNYSYNMIKPLIFGDVTKNIKFNAMCLLGTGRTHRIKLFQFFKLMNMNNINYSFNPDSKFISDKPPEDPNQLRNILNITSPVVQSIPHRINEEWCQFNNNIMFNKLDKIVPCKHIDPYISADNFDFYSNFAIDIVPETMFDCPHVFISEKTLRPILLKTPFIIFGAFGTLKYLKTFGFQTFSSVWDESYDLIKDPVDRFLSCTNLIYKINQMTLNEVKLLYDELTPILEHNRNILLDYIDYTYKPLYNTLYA